MGWEIDVVMWRYEERRGREEGRNGGMYYMYSIHTQHLRRLGKDIYAREDLSFSSNMCKNLGH
jgi:hypothetical protein